MTDAAIETDHIEPDNGVVIFNNEEYLKNPKGALVPIETIKKQDLKEDAAVRSIHRFALDLSEQIARFREHTFADLAELDALMEEHYGARPRGGAKGNRTYQTFDGLMKVTVQIQDSISFGPQLQIAKSLIDECMNEWAEDSRPELKVIIVQAFDTDKEGHVSPTKIYPLMRLDIEDPRWVKAMDALRDAMRVVSSKQYVRFYVRPRTDASWSAITIDLAKSA